MNHCGAGACTCSSDTDAETVRIAGIGPSNPPWERSAIEPSLPSVKIGSICRIGARQYVELLPEREAGGDRLAHIAVETDAAEAMRVYLKARGVAVPDKAGKGRIGNVGFGVKDPDGHTLEFVSQRGCATSASWRVRWMRRCASMRRSSASARRGGGAARAA